MNGLNNIENFEKPKHIKKIQFLIHPGFISDPNLEDVTASQRDAGFMRPAEELMDKYIEEAKTLGEDELVFAFLDSSNGQIKSHIQNDELYICKINELRDILGRRFIVLSGVDYHDFFDSPQEIFDDARRIAKARGYEFDTDTITEAYGECMNVCVEAGAIAFNRAGGFKEPTKIKIKLTNEPEADPREIRRIQNRIGLDGADKIDYEE